MSLDNKDSFQIAKLIITNILSHFDYQILIKEVDKVKIPYSTKYHLAFCLEASNFNYYTKDNFISYSSQEDAFEPPPVKLDTAVNDFTKVAYYEKVLNEVPSVQEVKEEESVSRSMSRSTLFNRQKKVEPKKELTENELSYVDLSIFKMEIEDDEEEIDALRKKLYIRKKIEEMYRKRIKKKRQQMASEVSQETQNTTQDQNSQQKKQNTTFKVDKPFDPDQEKIQAQVFSKYKVKEEFSRCNTLDLQKIRSQLKKKEKVPEEDEEQEDEYTQYQNARELNKFGPQSLFKLANRNMRGEMFLSNVLEKDSMQRVYPNDIMKLNPGTVLKEKDRTLSGGDFHKPMRMTNKEYMSQTRLSTFNKDFKKDSSTGQIIEPTYYKNQASTYKFKQSSQNMRHLNFDKSTLKMYQEQIINRSKSPQITWHNGNQSGMLAQPEFDAYQTLQKSRNGTIVNAYSDFQDLKYSPFKTRNMIHQKSDSMNKSFVSLEQSSNQDQSSRLLPQITRDTSNNTFMKQLNTEIMQSHRKNIHIKQNRIRQKHLKILNLKNIQNNINKTQL